MRCYAVLAPVSRSYSPFGGRLVTCYSPGRHFTHGLLHFLVRLACVRHAASVDSEPGSNSRLKPEIYSLRSRPPWPREGTTANFVSTLGLEPEPFHTVVGRRLSVVGETPRTSSQRSLRQTHLTGTFNLFVKDRLAFPPERRAFSPEQITRMRICLSSKPFETIVSSRCCQPAGIA